MLIKYLLLFLSSNMRFEIFKYTVILEKKKISPGYVNINIHNDEGKGKKRINFNCEKETTNEIHVHGA